MLFFNLKVADIRSETSDTKTLCLKQPGLKKIKYFPGQYLTLIFRINGRKYIRPYSFSSAPGIDEHLEVTVKRVPNGIVSNHINDLIHIGDTIEAMEPMGDFIFGSGITDENTHVVLWGAGSGITPLISIAKYILYKNPGCKVILIYGNRDDNSVIFKDKITELEQLFPGVFKVLHFHTKMEVIGNNPTIIEGRISTEKVLSIMRHDWDLANTMHFICGPAGLKDSIKQTLKSLLVSEELIFSEDFATIKDPDDFKDIFTQFVEVVKDEQISKVEVVKGKSILEASLDSLLDLEYSCQTGSCLLCKAKILSGEVKMVGLVKQPEKLLPGECLLCCSYPISNNVKVSTY